MRIYRIHIGNGDFLDVTAEDFYEDGQLVRFTKAGATVALFRLDAIRGFTLVSAGGEPTFEDVCDASGSVVDCRFTGTGG